MGYESRIYVAEKCDDFISESGRVFARVITSFDLSCVGNDVLSVIDKSPETDAFIFLGEHDEVFTDAYGKVMKEIAVPTLLETLEKAEANEHYRRYTPLIGMLKGFDLNEWDNLVCLHFGY